jgi:Mrp family chromosome partitioning ATPase
MMEPPEGAGPLLALRTEATEPSDAEVVRVVPVLASPPNLPWLAMLGQGRPEVAAALRIIRHRLELRRSEGMWVFGVTSARAGEGKSTLATQLALVLSEAQRARVLLIEASFHRPSLAGLLGFQVPPGLGFSLQIARRMRGSGEPWAVLALGPALHALVESRAEEGFPAALQATAFGQAIGRLGQAYDWVIVDAPSVLESGDANVVEEAVDGMIVAARSRRSRGRDLRSAMLQLGLRKVAGVVLWDARTAREASGDARA